MYLNRKLENTKTGSPPLVPFRILQKIGILSLEENLVLYVSSRILIIPIFWTGRYDVRHIPSLPVEALIAFESNENNQNFCPTLRVSLTQTGWIIKLGLKFVTYEASALFWFLTCGACSHHHHHRRRRRHRHRHRHHHHHHHHHTESSTLDFLACLQRGERKNFTL